MGRQLSKAALDLYHREGYLFPRRVISETEAAACKARLDDHIDRFGDDARGNGLMAKRPHLILRWVADLARNPAIVDAVEDIIGPDILCWSSSIFNKEAGSSRFVSWHQDANYWGLSSSSVVTAWIALTPATRENGCMRFLPGSHRTELTHVDITDSDNMLFRGQTITDDMDPDATTDVVLSAGEFALFHVNMAHSSLPNGSSEDRTGLVFRYVAGDVYQTKADFDSATLIRGEDRTGRFEHEPMPSADLDPAALAFHERVCGARKKVYFSG
jgi:ectoine hydroxylase-related dioxygenase (phytanoyl-CoA dioxygenase family)